jgi:hypothetical protein
LTAETTVRLENTNRVQEQGLRKTVGLEGDFNRARDAEGLGGGLVGGKCIRHFGGEIFRKESTLKTLV